MQNAIPKQSPEKLYENKVLTKEVKRSCTLGMLMALSEKQRMALILGEVYELDGREAAYIMETSPQAYRKQVSRARKALVGFLTAQCGLVAAANPCRCHKHVANKIRSGQLDPENLLYASRASPLHPNEETVDEETVVAHRTRLQRHRRAAALIRSLPNYEGNAEKLAEILKMFEQTRSTLN